MVSNHSQWNLDGNTQENAVIAAESQNHHTIAEWYMYCRPAVDPATSATVDSRFHDISFWHTGVNHSSHPSLYAQPLAQYTSVPTPQPYITPSMPHDPQCSRSDNTDLRLFDHMINENPFNSTPTELALELPASGYYPARRTGFTSRPRSYDGARGMNEFSSPRPSADQVLSTAEKLQRNSAEVLRGEGDRSGFCKSTVSLASPLPHRPLNLGYLFAATKNDTAIPSNGFSVATRKLSDVDNSMEAKHSSWNHAQPSGRWETNASDIFAMSTGSSSKESIHLRDMEPIGGRRRRSDGCLPLHRTKLYTRRRSSLSTHVDGHDRRPSFFPLSPTPRASSIGKVSAMETDNDLTGKEYLNKHSIPCHSSAPARLTPRSPLIFIPYDGESGFTSAAVGTLSNRVPLLDSSVPESDVSQTNTLNPASKRRKQAANFKCPHCRRDFTAKHNLTRHIRAHLGQKPFKCTCGASFTTKWDRKRHIKNSAKEECKAMLID